LLRNAVLLDGEVPHPRPGHEVLIEAGVIREIAERPIAIRGADIIDLAGRTLMPGLIDCHVHAVALIPDLGANARMPASLAAIQAASVLEAMLARGFTSVRDAGGADHGLALAIELGHVNGPRLFPSGKALSQTGGHADFRGRFDESEACACCRHLPALGRLVDGVDAVRKAVREEIKAGATQIKIMASGGVASPTDPIGYTQYSLDEIRAACEEARSAGTYVMAHAYTPAAIGRAVACGVRTVEHANLADETTACAMAERGAYAVPTLVTYEALAEEGAGLGLPAASVAKVEEVRGAGLASLELFRRNGVRMGFGTDLLGPMHPRQSEEFAIRARVLPPWEVIRSATAIGAEILMQQGRLGVLAPGAHADLIAIDGDPLADLRLLGEQGRHLALIIKAGRIVKNRCATAS
jgi:imidazolonepropionase-like amidohydrolase